MKVLIAVDSFKGSLNSMEAGRAVEQGVKACGKDAEVVVRPLADGGEGTVDALVSGLGGKYESVEVTGPLGDRVTARYGIAGGKAIMEMSSAAGLTLLPAERRNPLYTSTYGVGEMIVDAMGKGCRHFIIGIGGSATNDGGAGMLQALGFGFSDSCGRSVPAGAFGLERLACIDDVNVPAVLRECRFSVACDVSNPLYGPQGCSSVFGPQKGADPAMVVRMDKTMLRYAETVRKHMPGSDPFLPGAGAAGGLGFAFKSFTASTLESGVNIILRETGLEDYIKWADVVVTGEGRLDGQTVMGKAPIGVAALSKKYGKRVIAFAGSVSPDAALCNSHGIDAFFPILRTACTLEEAMDGKTAFGNLSAAAEQVFRLL